MSIPSGALSDNIIIKIELYNITCPPPPSIPYIPFFEIGSQEVLYAIDLWINGTINETDVVEVVNYWRES